MLGIRDFSILTPLGDAEQTIAGVNAGIGIQEISNVHNKNGDPLILAEIPGAAISDFEFCFEQGVLTRRRKRILNIAATCLSSLLEKKQSTTKPPIFLAASEKLPGTRTQIDARYLSLLLEPFIDSIDVDNSRVVPLGRAGFGMVLELAQRYLVEGGHQEVIVGGADSFIDMECLAILEADDRCLTPGISDAFIPAEGAGFILLSRSSNSGVNFCAWGQADEPGHKYSETPYTGEALAQAITNAVAKTGKAKFDLVYANLNGENFFAKEWGIAQLRAQKYMHESLDVLHPIDCFGDLGAALGPVISVLAGNKIAQGLYSEVMACFSSDLTSRSAICLTKQSAYS